MTAIATFNRNSSPSIENPIPIETALTLNPSSISIQDIVARIAIEALVLGQDFSKDRCTIPNAFTRGNTLVLSLGGSPIWKSRQEAVLPSDLFTSAPHDETGGIYARHVTCNLNLFHVLATRLGWLGSSELSLHSVAPTELAHDDSAFRALAELSAVFRSIVPGIAENQDSLRRHLTSDNPTLIVATTSGVVVALSHSCDATIAGHSSPLGQRYVDWMNSQSPEFSAQWTSRMIRMPHESSPVAIVVLEQRHASTSDDNDPAAFLFHNLRNKLTGIVTAATYLDSLSATMPSDAKEMTRIMVHESAAVERALWHLEALVDNPERDSRTSDLATTLDTVIERIAEIAPASRITTHSNAPLYPNCSQHSLAALIESVLLAHGHSKNHELATTIDAITTTGTIILRFTTQRDEVVGGRTCHSWRRYADALAKKIGATVAFDTDIDATQLITHLEINN